MKPIELATGVRIVVRSWLSSNLILLDDAAETVLVDSGHVREARHTCAQIADWLGGRPLGRILNTHLHSDHCGGNAALNARFGASVWVPEGQVQAVREWDEAALSFRATGQECARFPAHAGLRAGTQMRLAGRTWELVPAPGHDAHALMLYCAQDGWLISGDALWEQGFGVTFAALLERDGLDAQAAVLDEIARLRPSWVLPGHGAPFADVDAALARAHGRLARWRADPPAAAHHALKVMLAFWLLADAPLTLAELHVRAAQAHWMQVAAACCGASLEQIIPDVAGALVQGGQACWSAPGVLDRADRS